MIVLFSSIEVQAQSAGYALEIHSGNYVQGGNPGNDFPIGNSPRTIACWIKSSDLSGIDRGVFHYGTNGSYPGSDFHLYSKSTRVSALGNGYGYGGISGTKTLDDGNWHFLTGVYEGPTTNVLRLYIDGLQDGLASSSTVPNTGTGSNWVIGVFMNGYTSFNGLMDEVSLWNVALNEQEIRDIMNRRLTGSETGLVGYWPFDEGLGDTTTDVSGHGNRGNLVGNPSWILSTAPIGETVFFVEPLAMNFDLAIPGVTVTDSIKITNAGTTVLSVNSIQLSGAEASRFQVDPSPFILGSHESKYLRVSFSAQSQRTHTASLSIVSDSGSKTIALTANRGKAMYFDGDDEVVIPHASSLSFSPASTFTVELWFMPTQPRSIYHLLGKRNLCTENLCNYQIARDPPSLLSLDSGGDIGSSAVDPPLNEWLHFAMTYGDSILNLYVNDSLVVTMPFVITGENTVPLRLGNTSDNCPIAQRFLGLIDEVRIWDVVRTPDQIRCYYNRIIPPSTPGLIGYWNFDGDSSGQVVGDASPYNHNGSLGADTLIGSDDPIRIVSSAPIATLNHDAAVVRIVAPDSVVVRDSMLIPQTLVRNLGFETDTIQVHFSLGSAYVAASSIILVPGDSGVVSFPPWTASTYGLFPITAYAHVQGDSCTFNDTLKSKVAVIVPGSELAIFNTTPDNGGNSGTVSITIHGQGFQSGAAVKLSREGYQDILGFNATVIDSHTITTQFDLTGRQLGNWDVVVTDPGGQSTSLPGSFTISEGFVNLWAEIIGRPVIRVGKSFKYIITVGNSGNIDAKGTVLTLGGIPVEAIVEKLFKLDYPERRTGEDSVDWSHLPYIFEDSGKKQIPLYIPSLPAKTNLSLTVSVTEPASTDFSLQVSLSQPLVQLQRGSNIEPHEAFIGSECYTEIIKAAVGLLGGLLPQQCISHIAGVSGDIVDLSTHPRPQTIYSWIQLITDVTITGLVCAGEVHPVTSIIEKTWQAYEQSRTIASLYGACKDIIMEEWRSVLPVVLTSSWDPNEKVGPTGFGASHAVSVGRLFDYHVYFENKDSATAAAQEVELKDTLDANLDWSTFAFGDIQVGDSLLSQIDTSQTLNRTFHLNDTTDVDVQGSFNPGTGVIRWYMKGRDRRNGDLADFLPPNKDSVSPRGEGWVSFTVRPKAGLATATKIRNRASIVFDVNLPILTNEVFNTIDAGDPRSQITQINSYPDSGTMKITWSASDDSMGSGVHSYALYAEKDQGAFQPYATNLTNTSTGFPAEPGHTYRFMPIARDNVGNLEHWKAITDQSVAGLYQVSSRWNMVSLPLSVVDPRKIALFPSAVSSAFRYDPNNGYQSSDSLFNGSGYWVKFVHDENVLLQGFLHTLDTIRVVNGWNMIGSISSPLRVTDIVSNPPGIVTSQFFGYKGSYVVMDSLRPGNAYWVKANQGGQLVLAKSTTAGFFSARIKIVPTTELPPPVPEQSVTEFTIPKKYALEQNYPNPFNPTTVIHYQLPVQSNVALRIYNVLGQEVKTLVDEVQDAGYKSSEWNSTNNFGNLVGSGVYFYRLEATSVADPSKHFSQVKKMLLIR
ncbi:MAG: T9SS type A sorting domain-containing protein [Ignavibacteria bacterium]|nr:T9SS type A sorting domain-containing protein [Ignavibacteria bacterium]